MDWAHFPRVRIAGEVVDLYAFDLELSWSRYDALIWSERKDQLSWHHVHNEAFRRIGGVTATVRADNEKTAVVRGAGAWGQINDAYRRYAWCVHFHIDLCPPRMPRYKGKIERRIRDRRNCIDPRSRSWECLEELQVCSDEAVLKSAERRICPLTGTSVREAYEQELAYLQPLPLLPEPFDIVVSRRVSVDCLVSFEGRRMSVLFHYVDRMVEVRGCARKVQILADGRIVASWPRYTKERLLIDPRHYEGEGTGDILPPPPLGRMGRRLQEIADLPPESRPLDLYAALAEVAR